MTEQEFINAHLEHFKKMDADSNGEITAEEMKAAHQEMREKWKEKRAEKKGAKEDAKEDSGSASE